MISKYIIYELWASDGRTRPRRRRRRTGKKKKKKKKTTIKMHKTFYAMEMSRDAK